VNAGFGKSRGNFGSWRPLQRPGSVTRSWSRRSGAQIAINGTGIALARHDEQKAPPISPRDQK